jgi:hypothetical protein
MNKDRSNDHDFVPPTQYKSSRTKQPRPSLLSQLEQIPKFEAMELENVKGSSQIPCTSSPEDLFSLFFTESVLDRIVRCSNLNAERVRIDPVASRPKNIRFHDSLNQLPWKPVTSDEILAYLGIQIYMGIHVEPHINDYWNTNEEDGPIHQSVRKTMSHHRWNQINRYFHIWDPTSDQDCVQSDKVRPHQKVDPLWKLLSPSFQRYWKPGRDVSVDECIEGFTGRTGDTVNIPTKPTPIGFKIWVLSDDGYVLDLLWHVRGDGKDQGPQGLRTTWKELGFSRTQAVVLELMTRMTNGGKGHTVWIDNLFTSSKLLSTLRNYGIGAAGTVRTGQTKREENDERRQQKENRPDPKLPDPELSDPELLDPELLDPEVDNSILLNPEVLDPEILDPDSEFQQTIQKIRQDIHQIRFQDRTTKAKPQKAKAKAKKLEKEKNFGMNENLTELKTKWSNHIAWGKLYGCLSPDQKVLQLAWKDSQVVLFMTTVADARTTISRVRKRPNGGDKWIKAEFGDQPFKSLNIPEFIDMYNHHMNGVDRADQIRTYYRTKRRNYRTWKPLWNYLFQTTICNLALIWMDQGHSTKKNGGHLKFRTKLASQLMAHSSSSKYASPIDGFGVRTNLKNHTITSRNGCGGIHDFISRTASECKACMAQGRTAQACEKRKVLQELSENSIQFNQNGEKSRRPRPPRTKYGCSVCQIHLCKGGSCWEEHTQLSKLID